MCNICNYMYTLYRNFFWSPHVFIPSPFFSRWRPMARPRSRLLVTCSRASSGCAAKMPTKPLATTCRATVKGTAQKRRDKNDRNPGKRWWYSNFYVYIHIYYTSSYMWISIRSSFLFWRSKGLVVGKWGKSLPQHGSVYHFLEGELYFSLDGNHDWSDLEINPWNGMGINQTKWLRKRPNRYPLAPFKVATPRLYKGQWQPVSVEWSKILSPQWIIADPFPNPFRQLGPAMATVKGGDAEMFPATFFSQEMSLESRNN